MKISVLAAARKNSKYLAHFITGYLEQTSNRVDTELLVMTSEQDT